MAISIDWMIYRELYQQSKSQVWGMFPHPPLGKIATRLGVARSTVWERVRAWKESGFFLGYEVLPNPRLLGVGLMGYIAQVRDPKARRQFLEELEFVDGVVIANHNVGPKVTVTTVADAPSSQNRRENALARVAGVESIVKARLNPLWLPPCSNPLSAIDWKLIRSIREEPEVPMGRLAEKIRLPPRTFARAYRRLKESGALLSYTVEDFSKFPGTIANLVVRLDSADVSRSAAREMGRLFPDALEIARADRPSGTPAQELIFSFLVDAAPEIEARTVAAMGVQGVVRVEHYFPGAIRTYRHWFDARLFELVTRGSGGAPQRIPRARFRRVRDGVAPSRGNRKTQRSRRSG